MDNKSFSQLPSNLIEQKIVGYINTLKDLNISDEKITEIAGYLTSTANLQILAKISSLMDEEEFEKWKTFIDTDPEPNVAQQLIVMNAFLKRKANLSIEDITNEILESLMRNSLDEIKWNSELRQKISKLNPEDVKLAQKLLENEEYAELDKLLSKGE